MGATSAHGRKCSVRVLPRQRSRLHEGALARLLEPLQADDAVGLTAPVFTGQRPEASAGRAPNFADKVRRALNRTDVYRTDPDHGIGPWWHVDFAIGMCQLVRRSAFEDVGGIDDMDRFGPEDVDFCLRLRALGYRVVQVADVGCDHPPRPRVRRLTSGRAATPPRRGSLPVAHASGRRVVVS